MLCKILSLTAAAALTLPSAALGQTATPDAPSIKVEMKDLKGKSVGDVTLTQMPQGVIVRVDLKGLPPGWHAIHIHERLACDPPFTSAGGHFNPGGTGHGFDGEGPHAGDLPNIHVARDGTARADLINTRITLGFGQQRKNEVISRALGAVQSLTGTEVYNVRGGAGTSMVIHAQPDDYTSDPAGDAGDRLACGLIPPS